MTIWKDTSEEKARSEYGRNVVGGVAWRKDEKDHAMSVTTQDNFYAYDGLRQVRRHDRGELWNRLAEIKEGTTVVGAYTYDALTRRISKTTAAETRDYYYDRQWRALEERVSSAIGADYVYSPFDRWNLIRRRRSDTGSLDEIRYVLRDYLDPVAIIKTDGTLDERYGYDAFGPVRIMDKDFVTITASTVEWNWLFHGEFLDAERGVTIHCERCTCCVPEDYWYWWEMSPIKRISPGIIGKLKNLQRLHQLGGAAGKAEDIDWNRVFEITKGIHDRFGSFFENAVRKLADFSQHKLNELCQEHWKSTTETPPNQ